jgi:hypothetical protein
MSIDASSFEAAHPVSALAAGRRRHHNVLAYLSGLSRGSQGQTRFPRSSTSPPYFTRFPLERLGAPWFSPAMLHDIECQETYLCARARRACRVTIPSFSCEDVGIPEKWAGKVHIYKGLARGNGHQYFGTSLPRMSLK